MWFYKIDGVLDGFTFPEDRGTRSRAAQEFQSKQTLFSKKLQGKCYITVSQIKGGRITLAAVSLESYNILARCREFLREAEVPVKNLIAQEITYDVLRSLLQAAERWGFLEDDRDVYNLFHLEELQHNIYDFQEFLLPERATLGQQKKETAQLFCQDAFDPELERIYQGPVQLVNSGHPVHYLLVCDEGKARDKQVELLLSALYQNGRICSQRYTYMDFDSDERVDDSLLETLYSASAGGAMVLGYTPKTAGGGEFASGDMGVITDLCRPAKKHHDQVLTVLCLPQKGESAKKYFYENLGTMTFVELTQDVIHGERAKTALLSMAERSGLEADNGLFQNWQEDRGYRFGELRQLFEEWQSNKLKTEVYPQYASETAANKLVQKAKPQGSAYDKLEEMIGLTKAKEVIAQALDYYKAQKLFREKGISLERPAMHMVFTGNPGTAKTTVARLFAQIMKENGLLPVGDLIEVGRADLVGKYVGWTAPTVKAKFAAAKGSVLFIDEAYSLVDDKDGLFGDEAINTIVQEMENQRDDTVVIFAGYPDKMEQFLKKNPGLRSRIAFHIPFEDYKPAELLDIFTLMAKKQKLELAPLVRERLLPIFSLATKQPDFGNGRFVRNLLEKSRMKQASRLVRLDPDTVTMEMVSTLIPEDIDAPQLPQKEERRVLGFCA